MPASEKKFKRSLDSLAKVFELVNQFAERERIDDDTRHAISLAVDELFTNMVKHQPSNPNSISIKLRTEGENVIVEMIDRDVEPFDLTKKPDPDLGASLDDRKPGGLGIFLTKKNMDEIQYRHDAGTSIITLKKKFRRKHV